MRNKSRKSCFRKVRLVMFLIIEMLHCIDSPSLLSGQTKLITNGNWFSNPPPISSVYNRYPKKSPIHTLIQQSCFSSAAYTPQKNFRTRTRVTSEDMFSKTWLGRGRYWIQFMLLNDYLHTSYTLLVFQIFQSVSTQTKDRTQDMIVWTFQAKRFVSWE